MTTLEPKLTKAWIAHLEQELEIHRQLVAVADAKTVSLLEQNIPLLEAQVARERELLEIIGQLRIRRQRLRMLSAQSLETPADDLRMDRIIAAAVDEDQDRLREQEAQVKDVIKHLQRITERNAMLLRTSIGLVTDVINVVAGTVEEPASTYNRGGQEIDGPRRGGNLCSFEA